MNNLSLPESTVMRRPSRQLLLSSLAACTLIAGCTLIAETDRSKIDENGSGGMATDMGGNNGTGGDGSGGDGSGGTPSTGGAGGALGGSDPGGSSGSSN